jgi:cytochrome c biogenesis protein CcdA
MTHLPFILGAYALGIAVPVIFAVAARLRLGRAQRRLAALDRRRSA